MKALDVVTKSDKYIHWPMNKVSQDHLQTSETDAASVDGLADISKAPQKKVVEIKGADLNMVMNATGLARQDAIDLITKTDGNIKEALNLYVTQ